MVSGKSCDSVQFVVKVSVYSDVPGRVTVCNRCHSLRCTL